ncbi:hypothetical protein Poly30_47990 [Planctomycetes bacterium Poly30]|uniref:Uncharacterized protein n=1 Tax=Saltatorellus ferox TaxID=2528018 RepID=A0A518EYT0_9BACT|nr:hypothetical protein Poly30_47990 [Planctomycetes bacterium Poly30]
MVNCIWQAVLKFELGIPPGATSRCQYWTPHVSPTCMLMNPVGVGTIIGSIVVVSMPAAPLLAI